MSTGPIQQVAPGEAAPVFDKSDSKIPQPTNSSSNNYLDNVFQTLSPITKTYNRFIDWRKSLALGQPGTTEGLGREAKS